MSATAITGLVEEKSVIELEAELDLSMPFPLATGLPMRTLNSDRKLEVLLVEDNPADVRLTREVFENGDGATHLNVVGDGEQAMAFLRRQGPYADQPRPCLLLLDLNLPRKDGREVLAELKEDRELRHIPVVVLTTSAAESDIVRSYELHANCYITKPVDLEQFIVAVKSIENFWFTVVTFPAK